MPWEIGVSRPGMKCSLPGKLGKVRLWNSEVEGARGYLDRGLWEWASIPKYVWEVNWKANTGNVALCASVWQGERTQFLRWHWVCPFASSAAGELWISTHTGSRAGDTASAVLCWAESSGTALWYVGSHLHGAYVFHCSCCCCWLIPVGWQNWTNCNRRGLGTTLKDAPLWGWPAS